MRQIQIHPSAGYVGAEISGLDLAQTLSDTELEQVKNTLFEYGVVFFREQNMRPEDHIRLAEQISEIDINRFFKPVDGYPKIAEVRKEPDQTVNIGSMWHSDHSYDTAPAMGSILVAREVPPYGGDTVFASMYAAYDHLSDGLKATLEGLKAWHTSSGFAAPADKEIGDRLGGQDRVTPDVLQNAVIKHPITGRKALYVNETFTVGFEGWTAEESKPLLDYLFQHAVKPAFCYRFSWRPGSVAFWDNRVVQHLAINDYHGHRRLMHRITLKGVQLQG